MNQLKNIVVEFVLPIGVTFDSVRNAREIDIYLETKVLNKVVTLTLQKLAEHA